MAISRVNMVPYLDIEDCVSKIRTFPFYFMIKPNDVQHTVQLVTVDLHEDKPLCAEQAVSEANNVNKCLRCQNNSGAFNSDTVSLPKKYRKCPNMEHCYHNGNGIHALRTGSETCLKLIGTANVKCEFSSRCLDRSASFTKKPDKVSNSMPLFGTMDHSPTKTQVPAMSYGNAASLGHLEDSGYGSSGACECRHFGANSNLTNVDCRQCFHEDDDDGGDDGDDDEEDDDDVQTRYIATVDASHETKSSKSSGAKCRLKMENENDPHASFEYDNVSIPESLEIPVQEMNATELPSERVPGPDHTSLPMDHNGQACRSDTFPCLRKIEKNRITRSRKFSRYLSPLYVFIPIIGMVLALLAYRSSHRKVARHRAHRDQRAHRDCLITAATVIVNILITIGLLVIVIVITLKNIQGPQTTIRNHSLTTVTLTTSSQGPKGVAKHDCISRGKGKHSLSDLMANGNTNVKWSFQNDTAAAYFNPCKNKTEVVTFDPSLL